MSPDSICLGVVRFVLEFLQMILLKAATIILQLVTLPLDCFSLLYQYIWQKPKTFRSVMITGASSGIGLHFALEMSKQTPPPRLVLIARRLDKLRAAQQQCIQNGCRTVEIYACDVTDRNRMTQVLTAQPPFDLIVANAGYRGDVTDALTDCAYKTFDVNLYGVLNSILPIIPSMVDRKHGQIVITASIAALTPHKLFPFYSTSKHCLLALAENLRSTLHEYNIGVTVVLPGFVQTELVSHLTDKGLSMIGKIDATQASEHILYAASYNHAIYGFPFVATLLGYLYESLSLRAKQMVLDYNVIDRIIGWYNAVPNRHW